MCLRTNRTVAQKYLKKWHGKKKITVYKVLQISTYSLKSPFHHHNYQHGITRAKTYVRAKLGTCKNNNKIHHGLHVFLSRKIAEDFVVYMKQGTWINNYVVVPFEANPSDCVAIGFFKNNLESGVFKNLKLYKNEYNKVFERYSENHF